MYSTAKELYCDATIFFWFFIVYLPKKNGNWKMAQGCRLSPTSVHLSDIFLKFVNNFLVLFSCKINVPSIFHMVDIFFQILSHL